MKIVTILFLRKGDQVLLAMKKRGFGQGKWNGVGGKTEPGESPSTAAIRECQEEIGVTPINPKLVGKIEFHEEAEHYAHVYVADKWKGDPQETEEMRPQWFAIKDIPYKNMWADDEYWYPIMFDGKLFQATFTLNDNRIVSHDIKIVDKLTEIA